MKYHAFLIKYAEIGIKGKNRYLFEDALVKHIRLAMERVEGEFEVRRSLDVSTCRHLAIMIMMRQ